MTTKLKYRAQTVTKGMYRLTLSAEAFALAIFKSVPISGYVAYPRLDGQWDVMVSPATADQLQQQREEGEHLTDVVVRLLGGVNEAKTG